MDDGAAGTVPPTRARMIFATIFVAATVLVVWKVIDYRTQPPPPLPASAPAASTP